MADIILAGSTSGAITISAPAISGTNTLTLPVATDTLVGKATTDTLTNKTLTSPVLTTPALGTPASGVLTNCTGVGAPNFTSAELTIPASTTQTAAHGLSSLPRLLMSSLRCKTAELGYSIGDEIQAALSDAPGASIISVWADATNVGLTGSSGLRIGNRTTPGTASAITAGNWRIVIKAWI